MIATPEYVKERYAHFNEVCFEGTLPEVPIVLTKAKTFLGKLEYQSVKGLFGRVVSIGEFRIKISTLYDLPEAELEDVIIHEMIHLYIASHRIKDSSSHGKVFREMMTGINNQHGRHITVSHPRAKALAEQVGKLGYAGTSTRTRAFTAYDEFLLYSYIQPDPRPLPLSGCFQLHQRCRRPRIHAEMLSGGNIGKEKQPARRKHHHRKLTTERSHC